MPDARRVPAAEGPTQRPGRPADRQNCRRQGGPGKEGSMSGWMDPGRPRRYAPRRRPVARGAGSGCHPTHGGARGAGAADVTLGEMLALQEAESREVRRREARRRGRKLLGRAEPAAAGLLEGARTCRALRGWLRWTGTCRAADPAFGPGLARWFLRGAVELATSETSQRADAFTCRFRRLLAAPARGLYARHSRGGRRPSRRRGGAPKCYAGSIRCW